MDKIISFIMTVMAISLLAGCASMGGGAHEKIKIRTTPVEHAHCVLINHRGKWIVDTPAIIEVHPDRHPITVDCTSGYRDGHKEIPSTANPRMFGDLVIPGGMIASLIDRSKGSAYRYPPEIVITLKPASSRKK